MFTQGISAGNGRARRPESSGTPGRAWATSALNRGNYDRPTVWELVYRH
jgi:hypothetical protein